MHYYNVKNLKNFDKLVPMNLFWADLIEHIIIHKSLDGFLSTNFIYAVNSYTELIVALAVIGLPFAQGLHLYQQNNNAVDIVADHDLISYCKQIIETEKADEEVEDVLIVQRFFEPNNRYEYTSNNKKVEKFINKFYARRVYGCQVVVTNVGNRDYNAQVITRKSTL